MTAARKLPLALLALAIIAAVASLPRAPVAEPAPVAVPLRARVHDGSRARMLVVGADGVVR